MLVYKSLLRPPSHHQTIAEAQEKQLLSRSSGNSRLCKMWSDIFYPGNPGRRENVIRKSQRLHDLMSNNFKATNDLIATVNRHLNLRLCPITLDNDASIKQNCELMTQCIQGIQTHLEKIDKELQEKMDPDLYDKIKKYSPKNVSRQDLQKISKAFNGICGIATLGGIVLIGVFIKQGVILANITSTFLKFAGGVAASVGLGVLLMGVDMIVEAIVGAIERKHLETALHEYETALNELEPVSDNYQKNIHYIMFKIEEIEKSDECCCCS
ncbi:hypothetical protein DNTS_010173 [Danionella cerebrum]|uniref:Single-pass membrane and coiled-coil domain-containing protein 3 n=1 Tax=Danionella cerebrum TaxID=2873325 RepID=A0A553Q6N8_9TELE|nr:hypothetical protein DNTS_010173 [Danionella translucida]